MPASLRLNRQQIADFKTIASASIDSLKQIVSHAASLQPSPLQAKQLRKEILFIVQDEQVVDAIMRQMFGLHGLMGQMRLSVEEVFAGLRAGLQSADPKWKKDELAAWKQREPVIRELLDVDSLRIVAKVLDLSYEYANLLRNARIITDVRPVFTSDAKGVDGAIISHKLFVRYDNVEGLKTLTMTLDEGDVKTLKQQCERALQKAEAISSHLTSGSQVRTIIPGRDSDD